MEGSGVGNCFDWVCDVVEESTEDTKISSNDGIKTAPTIVGTGGGIGIGVVFATVCTVKETDTSIAGTAITFPTPEGEKKTT